MPPTPNEPTGSEMHLRLPADGAHEPTATTAVDVGEALPPPRSPGHEEDPDRIDLVWKDVRVTARGADGRDIVLLHDVAGSVSEGLVAIMGPSGSGKTTLLNSLACRLDPHVAASGTLHINGEPYTTSKLKRFLGYVMQDDAHSEMLTVRETLSFVADVRLRKLKSAAERARLVDDAMRLMTLTHVADVCVGSGNSGIAGGEKKRLSVAKELLTRPKMLFLDEPTSNLDSLDALQFIQSMRRLVETGCVVVCTIHQPQFKVFSTFDRLLMLRSGSIVFDGPVSDVGAYCANMLRPVPPQTNPADHLMSVVSPDLGDSFRTDQGKLGELRRLYADAGIDVDVGRGRGRDARYLREPVPFSSRCFVGMHRAVVLLGRRRNEWFVNLLITIVNAVLVGTVFLRIGDGPGSVAKRLPALFFTVVNQAIFGAISTISVLPSERNVIQRERTSGNMSALAYFATKALAEIVWKLPFPIVFTIITYFLIGFQATAAHFFKFLGAMILGFITGMAVAFMVSAVARISSISSLALPLFMEVSRLFSGYFIAPALQPAGLHWIDYISYHFYVFSAVAQNEMGDLMITCSPEPCTPTPAVNQLLAKGLYMSYGEAMGLLSVYFSVAMILAYCGVRFITW